MLGYASIVTTERYDNQKQEALFDAAKRLETGESFKNLSRSLAAAPAEGSDQRPTPGANLLDDEGIVGGVSDGD